MSGMVRYVCHRCGDEFFVLHRGRDLTPDEDITLCWSCIERLFK